MASPTMTGFIGWFYRWIAPLLIVLWLWSALIAGTKWYWTITDLCASVIFGAGAVIAWRIKWSRR